MRSSLKSRISGSVTEPVREWPCLFLGTISAEDDPVFVNGQAAAEGSYLVPDRQGLVRAVGLSDFSEFEIPQEAVIDDDHARSIVEIVGSLASPFANGELAWGAWTETSPLMPGISDKADLTSLDEKIRTRVPSLVGICRKPRHNLIQELERVPVGRARRTTNRAAAFLASHPEDWDRPTIAGPRPKRVLAEIPNESLDMFENRMVARLIDRCDRYLIGRVRELHRLIMLCEEISDLQDLMSSHWARQNRLYDVLAELFEQGNRIRTVKRTLEIIVATRYRVLGLTDSALYREVPRRASVSPVLPATNILENDFRYRDASRLWRDIGSGERGSDSPEAFHRRACESFEGFDLFVLLLVINACDRFGVTGTSDARIRPDVDFLIHHPVGGELFVRFDSSRRVVVLQAGDRRMRIVPVYCPIDDLRPEDAALFERRLDSESRTTTDEIVFVYPDGLRRAEGLEGGRSPWLLQLRHELPANARRPFSCLSVSPWRVGSQDDVARAVNWFVLAQRYVDMPPTIEVPRHVADLVQGCRHLLRPGVEQTYSVISPEIPPAVLESLRSKSEVANAIRGEIESIESRGPSKKDRGRLQKLKVKLTMEMREASAAADLLAELEGASTRWRAIRCCPICRTADANVSPREVGFWCECPGCHAAWGTQRCASCGILNPCIRPHHESWTEILKSGKSPSLVAGSDLLAAPVLASNEDLAFRCHSCGSVE